MPQSLSTCLCLCVNSHIPPFAASPQHTDRCEDRRERARERGSGRASPDCGARPRCANIALLSPVCLLLSLRVCLSPSWSHCIPTVPNTEGLFVAQRRKCNWSQIGPPLCLKSPAFILMVSHHAACPKDQSDTWKQRRWLSGHPGPRV